MKFSRQNLSLSVNFKDKKKKSPAQVTQQLLCREGFIFLPCNN
jgi:hypothetical protein